MKPENLYHNTQEEFTYCWKCGITLKLYSPNQFCSSECRREYYAEIRKENDCCFNEFFNI